MDLATHSSIGVILEHLSKDSTHNNDFCLWTFVSSYFTRVVPSDIHQATALVDIVTHFNWSVVATVATDDLAYGVPGLDRFLLKSKSNGVCVALESRIGSSTTKEQLIDIVNQIRLVELNNRGRPIIFSNRSVDNCLQHHSPSFVNQG